MTPARQAALAVLRQIVGTPDSELIHMVIDRAPPPWVREAFYRGRPVRLGIYWLNGPEGEPWPAAAFACVRKEHGRRDREAVGLVTWDQLGRPVVSGRDRVRLKADRLAGWGEQLPAPV